MDEDFVRIDQEDAKRKLNQVFEYVHVQKINDM